MLMFESIPQDDPPWRAAAAAAEASRRAYNRFIKTDWRFYRLLSTCVDIIPAIACIVVIQAGSAQTVGISIDHPLKLE